MGACVVMNEVKAVESAAWVAVNLLGVVVRTSDTCWAIAL